MSTAIAPIRQGRGVTSDSFVVQANSLARARYGTAANIHGMRLIVVAIAMVDQDMDLLNQICIPTQQLREIFPGYQNTKNLGSYVSDAADRMMHLRAETYEKDGEWRKVNVISAAHYKPGNGLTITFHPEMKQFLLKLTGSYTRYRLKAISRLTSTYQFQLYQFLKSHAHHGNVMISIEDLRNLFDIEAKAYPIFKDFRRRVLDPTVEAINATTDIQISYTPEKDQGRSYSSILFLISANAGAESLFDLGAQAVLEKAGLSKSAAVEAVRSLHCMPSMRLLAAVRARAARPGKKKIENFAAYLAGLLRRGVLISGAEYPDYEKHLGEVMTDFRMACYRKLEPNERQFWLNEFKKVLSPNEALDLDRRSNALEPPLMLIPKFHAFLRENLNPDSPGFRLSA